MLKSIQKGIIVLFSIALFACAGRTPNPIDVYQPNDNKLSCDQIKAEIQRNQKAMFALYPKTQKTGKNVALGVAGAFFIVPLFFMDFSDAEQIEIKAFQRRDEHLHKIAERKKCGQMPAKIDFESKKQSKKRRR
ncbi:MAG: hypothetical protein GKR77_01740 [Legionellales bacterium]|nr:hypothetical protein [Legionellales bacterium]